MPSYHAPLRDYMFLLEHVLDYSSEVAALPGYGEASLDVVAQVLAEGARLAETALAPLNRSGDEEGCAWDNGKVRTPVGFREAYRLYREGGWPGLTADPAHGGQGLPHLVGLVVREIVAGANMSFGMYPGLSQGAYRAIATHGAQEVQAIFLPRLVDGTWTGTMCLTEPHCGTDLGLVKTKARPEPDGTYRLSGTKIFISSGEHDLSDNIVHLVLARLPGAPPGIKGISLFAVPKLLPGSSTPNGVTCAGIEHKMGIRASATATLVFEDANAWLVGTPHKGMRAMFTMMNAARLGVSVQAVALAEAAYQNARLYARDRLQGRAPGQMGAAPVPIIVHPDVRRNLLIGKAFVEGGRALWMWVGVQLDRQHHHPDAAVRAECSDLLALLTPVLKAFLSDRALEVTNAAMQVFGGHGYIRETGIEQYVRDGRIIPLYEGTNGIQALDLVSRKIPLNEGATVNAFFARVSAEVEAARETLPGFAASLASALDLLEAATDLVRTGTQDDPDTGGAAAHDYLQLFGFVAMGFAWLKIARAAMALRAEEHALLARSKLNTAAFFFARMLPETEFRFRAVSAGTHATMVMASDEF